ncbi:MAG TPA: hypothetical protein VHQ65_12685 [Thermoanaerobaculia bacterium]|nr:hypothetical protein [Thermoanaerobaculia bacterium]
MLQYELNPKHEEPWQRGRRGSLCPPLPAGRVQSLLHESVQVGSKRFSVHAGAAFCGHEHRLGFWHGYRSGGRRSPPSFASGGDRRGSSRGATCVGTGQEYSRQRVAWLAGPGHPAEQVRQRWASLLASVRQDTAAFEKAFTAPTNELVVTGTCQAAPMFGSASPTITQADAAFAAMFLMPQQRINQWLRTEGIDPKALAGVEALARKAGTSYSAMAHHLHNLGLIAEHTRDALLEDRLSAGEER